MAKFRDPVNSCLWLLRFILLGVVIIILMMTRAKADETVLAESLVGSGGLICDTTQEVTQFIDLVDQGIDSQEALQAIEGCGLLVKPMRMRVTSVGTYETERRKFLIVRYEFLDAPMPPQYGVHAQALRSTGI